MTPPPALGRGRPRSGPRALGALPSPPPLQPRRRRAHSEGRHAHSVGAARPPHRLAAAAWMPAVAQPQSPTAVAPPALPGAVLGADCEGQAEEAPAPKRPEKRKRNRAKSIPIECRLIHPRIGAWRTASTLAQLYWKVQWWVGLPGKWLSQFTRLLAFAVILLPFFLPRMWAYIRSSDILKNVVYGPSLRNQLDIYKPLGLKEGQKAPVVIFVCGGAWIIGYKAWAFIMGQLFQRQGVLFIAPDYRNFPQVTVGGMVQDVAAAVAWVLDNLEVLGGDPENVTLMGQSCGAHITSLLLLEQAEREAQQRPRLEDWSVRSLTRWIGISGPYDILDLLPTLHQRGLHRSVARALMDQDVLSHSPYRRVRDLIALKEQGKSDAASLLPPVHLFHGTADATVPFAQADRLAEVLGEAGVAVSTRFYAGKSHTDPILEDPIEGEGDALMADLLRLVSPRGQPAVGEGVGSPPEKPQAVAAAGHCPPRLKAALLRWGRFVNPF